MSRKRRNTLASAGTRSTRRASGIRSGTLASVVDGRFASSLNRSTNGWNGTRAARITRGPKHTWKHSRGRTPTSRQEDEYGVVQDLRAQGARARSLRPHVVGAVQARARQPREVGEPRDQDQDRGG